MLIRKTWTMDYRKYRMTTHHTFAHIKSYFKYTDQWDYAEKKCDGLFLFGFIPLYVHVVEE